MAQPTLPVADAAKRGRGIDPEDPKWWRRFRRKAHAERQVRVELAIYAKDSRFLYAGAPYEFPQENVHAEGQNADADGVPSEMQEKVSYTPFPHSQGCHSPSGTRVFESLISMLL
jgi:hypothetical protein